MPNTLSTIGAFWLVEPIRAQTLLDGKKPSEASEEDATIEASCGMAGRPAQERPYHLHNGIAIIPVRGLMTKDWSWWGDVYTKRLRAVINAAVEDADVKGTLFVVDSPGGDAQGCQELFDAVREAARVKPTDVFFEDCGASAAYYGFCGARRLVSNATGWVGCLGTVSSITDWSGMFEKEGIKKYVFSTGPLKGAGIFGSKITEAQRSEFQRIVDQYGEWFLRAVMKGRKMGRAKAEALFTGGMFSAPEAIANGLIDAIGTLDAAVSDLLAYADSCPAGTYPMVEADDDVEDALIGSDTHTPPSEQSATSPKQISAATAAGSTGPEGAGKDTHSIGGGKHPMNWKDKLVRALSNFKLGPIALAVMNSKSEDPEELASVMAEQVEATVQAKLNEDPLMVGCRANGITSPEVLAKVLEMKNLGERVTSKMRTHAKAEAIRAYDTELGGKVSAQVDSLSYDEVEALAASWTAAADEKYRIAGKDGKEGATRQTAPSGATKLAADVDADEEPKSNWEKLTEDQKAFAAKHYKTAADRELYAKNFLGAEAVEVN